MIGDNVVIICAVDALKYHKQIVIDATPKKLKFVLIKNQNLTFISESFKICFFVIYDVNIDNNKMQNERRNKN